MINSSFRDPSGYLFVKDKILYRRMNDIYKPHYEYFITSGLYDAMVDAKLLIPHDELNSHILKPEYIDFISYPYEWCFSQLKDAALLTLAVQKMALHYGMTLKDASAYNVQFHKGKPIFIDTLSFEKYIGKPWVAYKQFCEHFLAPLALMSYKDDRLSQLLKSHIDGIPLDLASKLLPSKTYLNFGFAMHIHAHAKAQKKYADKIGSSQNTSLVAQFALIDSLQSCVNSLSVKVKSNIWTTYYNYESKYIQDKMRLVSDYLRQCKPRTIWDIGANTGLFSRLTSKDAQVYSFDCDMDCVELNYRRAKWHEETNILPLVSDITNPSPGIGWINKERTSLLGRCKADTVMALALVHHLAITNNIPLSKIANLFQDMGKYLIIEFVPKSDDKVQKLLQNREDIFTDYTQEHFESEFKHYFTIEKADVVKNSQRTLYLMRHK